MTEQLVLEDRLAAELQRRAERRLVDAVEETRAAAKALGLEPTVIGELYAPLALRVDAWLERTRHLLPRGGCDAPR